MRLAAPLVAVGLAASSGCGSHDPERLVLPPASSRPLQGRAKAALADPSEGFLSRRLSLELRGTTLTEACRLFTRLSGADTRLELSPGLSGLERVSMRLERARFSQVLDWVCRQVDGFWCLEASSERMVCWIGRDLPKAVTGARAACGHSLHAVVSPPGGIRVERGEAVVEVLQDPARSGEPLFERADTGFAQDERARLDRATAGFSAILDEALSPVGGRWTAAGRRLVLTGCARAQARTREILKVFEREPPPALPQAPSESIPTCLVTVEISAADFEEALLELSRAAGVAIGYDPRELPADLAVRLSAREEPFGEVLARLLKVAGWEGMAPEGGEPASVWVSRHLKGPQELASRQHPFDRCRALGFPLPARWLSEKGPAQVLAAFRAELSPLPTRGMGRVLAIHEPTGLLVAVLEPEAMARIPEVLADFRRGRWPGWKEEEPARRK